MHAAALPARAKHPADRRLQPLMRIRDDQLHPAQTALGQALEEARPEGLGLGRADMQADDLAPALAIDRNRDYRRDRDNATAFALLQVGRVQPEIRPIAGERAIKEGVHPLVDLLAQLRDLRLADPGQ